MFGGDGKILFLFVVFGFSHAAIVDNIKKCSIKDFECQKDLYQYILYTAATSGIPEVGIEQTDPFVIKNVSVDIFNLGSFTLVEGTAKGVESCVIHKIRTDLEAKNFTMDFTCNFKIAGKYKLNLIPDFSNLLGGAVQGEGFAKADIEKVRIKAEFEFFVRRGKDGEVYCDYSYEGMKFAFTFGKLKMGLDNLYIGNQEMSGPIMQILNNNWKFFVTNFGRPFVLRAMDIFFEYTHKWYDNIPANNYIMEDLSSFLDTK